MLREDNYDEVIVIDVRSAGEFSGGHIDGSVNIPLNELEYRIDELKDLNKPIVLCCASGMRSAVACDILKQKGIKNIQNGGSWAILQYRLNDNKQIK